MHLKSAAHRRYLWRFFPTMGAYVVLFLGATWLFKHHPPQGILRYVVAIAPALPVVGVIAILGLYLAEEKDEFARATTVQGMLWGIGASLTVSTITDALTNFGIAPPPPTFSAFIVFAFVWGLAQVIIRRSYR